ncbi:MAG TPA: response regulator [Bryobacteraceae bacterium]|jgi:CheY-like chemotaxis protein|nr:response regulator [Bryobacteraceae bacterium]
MTETLVRPLRIFLAEDNRADVYLVELALKEEDLQFILCLASDGEAALKIVATFGETEPAPDIALLDLNLPRHDGDQVLRSLRNHPRCACTPIIIMTSSDSVRDRDTAQRYQAVFFTKPSDLSGFLELGRLVKTLCEQSQSAGVIG